MNGINGITNFRDAIAARKSQSDAATDTVQLGLSLAVAFQDVLDACGALKSAEAVLDAAHRRYIEQRRQLEAAQALMAAR